MDQEQNLQDGDHECRSLPTDELEQTEEFKKGSPKAFGNHSHFPMDSIQPSGCRRSSWSGDETQDMAIRVSPGAFGNHSNFPMNSIQPSGCRRSSWSGYETQDTVIRNNSYMDDTTNETSGADSSFSKAFQIAVIDLRNIKQYIQETCSQFGKIVYVHYSCEEDFIKGYIVYEDDKALSKAKKYFNEDSKFPLTCTPHKDANSGSRVFKGFFEKIVSPFNGDAEAQNSERDYWKKYYEGVIAKKEETISRLTEKQRNYMIKAGIVADICEEDTMDALDEYKIFSERDYQSIIQSFLNLIQKYKKVDEKDKVTVKIGFNQVLMNCYDKAKEIIVTIFVNYFNKMDEHVSKRRSVHDDVKEYCAAINEQNSNNGGIKKADIAGKCVESLFCPVNTRADSVIDRMTVSTRLFLSQAISSLYDHEARCHQQAIERRFWTSINHLFPYIKDAYDEKRYKKRVEETVSIIWKLVTVSSPIILWSKTDICFNDEFHTLCESTSNEKIIKLCNSKDSHKPFVEAYLTPTIFSSNDGPVAKKGIVVVRSVKIKS